MAENSEIRKNKAECVLQFALKLKKSTYHISKCLFILSKTKKHYLIKTYFKSWGFFVCMI